MYKSTVVTYVVSPLLLTNCATFRQHPTDSFCPKARFALNSCVTVLHLSRIIISMFQRDPRAGAFLGGDRVSGQEIRDQNGALNLAIILRDL